MGGHRHDLGRRYRELVGWAGGTPDGLG